MGGVAMLERSDLQAFERQLSDLAVPVVRYLRPSRSEAEFDRAEARLGFASDDGECQNASGLRSELQQIKRELVDGAFSGIPDSAKVP